MNGEYAGLWCFAVLAGPVLAVLAIILIRRRFRAQKPAASNVCATCGYDFQGLPTDRPCPECGRVRQADAPGPAAAGVRLAVVYWSALASLLPTAAWWFICASQLDVGVVTGGMMILSAIMMATAIHLIAFRAPASWCRTLSISTIGLFVVAQLVAIPVVYGSEDDGYRWLAILTTPPCIAGPLGLLGFGGVGLCLLAFAPPAAGDGSPIHAADGP